MANCHSITENPHHAHWHLNKEKTSAEEGYTHGEMVRGLSHTRCQIRSKNQNGHQTISLDIDTEVRKLARLRILARGDSFALG
jgi:hypothetical protein